MHITTTFRRITIALAASASLPMAACGSGDPGAVATIAPADARASIEEAAGIRLTAERLPAGAREEGLVSSFSNAKTVVDDRQAVALFVLEDEEVADEVSDRVRSTAPKSAKLIVHGSVIVVYAAAGTNRAAAVERSVKAL